MAVEAARGCGYRKVGGLYMVGGGFGMECDQLPYELKTCPTCGAGIKFTRGFQWLDWIHLDGEHMDEPFCTCDERCPICQPGSHPQPYGLMWVGSDYTPAEFAIEAMRMGISKRIAAIPRKLKLGETWVLFAHRSACGTRKNEDNQDEGVPGVFYAFIPQRIELLIWQRDAKPEYLEDLERRGITPVIIPDGDLDHDPATNLKPTDDERTTLENQRFFGSLRERLAGLKDMEEE